MKYKNKNEERAWEMFRKSVGPRVWSGRDLGTWFAMGVFIGVMLVAPYTLGDDNIITMEQTGDTFQLGVDQFGHSNEISMLDGNSYINASTLDMYLVQVNTSHTALATAKGSAKAECQKQLRCFFPFLAPCAALDADCRSRCRRN